MPGILVTGGWANRREGKEQKEKVKTALMCVFEIHLILSVHAFVSRYTCM